MRALLSATAQLRLFVDRDAPHDPKLDAWVRKVNRLAEDIDADARMVHPSAWPETLGQKVEQFRRLAGSGP